MLKIINLYYVYRFRISETIPKPHPKIVYAVNQINEKYNYLGIPFEVGLKDLDTFLRSLTIEQLVSIVQKEGKREDLIELIQTPISFEEARKIEGIEEKDGKWYYKSKELKTVSIDFEADETNYKFRKDFYALKRSEYLRQRKDFKKIIKPPTSKREHKVPETYTKDFIYEIKQAREFERKHHGKKREEIVLYINMSEEEYIVKRFEEDKEKLAELSSQFLEGSSKLFGDIIEICALYINSITDLNKRKKEFERFRRILQREFRGDKLEWLIRISPSEGYEGYYGYYPYIKGIREFDTNTDLICFLSDKFEPNFRVSRSQTFQPYMILRPYSSSFCSFYDIDSISQDKITFLILHELTHLVTHQVDIKDIDREGDKRLMLAPVYYEEVSDEYIRRKMSDESIIVSYNKVIR